MSWRDLLLHPFVQMTRAETAARDAAVDRERTASNETRGWHGERKVQPDRSRQPAAGGTAGRTAMPPRRCHCERRAVVTVLFRNTKAIAQERHAWGTHAHPGAAARGAATPEAFGYSLLVCHAGSSHARTDSASSLTLRPPPPVQCATPQIKGKHGGGRLGPGAMRPPPSRPCPPQPPVANGSTTPRSPLTETQVRRRSGIKVCSRCSTMLQSGAASVQPKPLPVSSAMLQAQRLPLELLQATSPGTGQRHTGFRKPPATAPPAAERARTRLRMEDLDLGESPP